MEDTTKVEAVKQNEKPAMKPAMKPEAVAGADTKVEAVGKPVTGVAEVGVPMWVYYTLGAVATIGIGYYVYQNFIKEKK